MASRYFHHDPSIAVALVEAELRDLDSPGKSFVRTLPLLVGSLVLFVALQAFSTTLTGIAVLIVVLLVHELGHLLAMKAFGYRDVQMFFIPLFGAAVSGSQTRGNGANRAIVSLLGPVPGIVIGVVCAVLFHRTGQVLYMQAARTFLLVNTFNLLPFVPLDGGRYLEAILFSRTPMLRALFDVVAGLAMVALAIALRSVILGFIALFVFRSIKLRYFSSQLADQIKGELAAQGPQPDTPTEASAPNAAAGSIPSSYIERLIPLIEAHLPEPAQNTKGIARAMRDIWNMVAFTPPSAGVTVGLVCLYLAAFGGGVIATAGAEISFRPNFAQEIQARARDAAYKTADPGASLQQMCNGSADYCYDLSDWLRSRGRVAEAATANETYVRGARDKVAASNRVEWLVRYYQRTGRQADAKRIAEEAASTGSQAGMSALAGFYERDGDAPRAQVIYRQIYARYDGGQDLLAFYMRHPPAAGTSPDTTEYTQLMARYFDGGLRPGVPVESTTPPARGLRVTRASYFNGRIGFHAGDIVTALDGVEIRTPDQSWVLYERSFDAPLRYTVWRTDKYLSIEGAFREFYYGVDTEPYVRQ